MSKKIIIEEDKLQEILDAVEGKNLNLFPLLVDIITQGGCKIVIIPDQQLLNCFLFNDEEKIEDRIFLASGIAGYANDFCRNIIIGMVKHSLDLVNELKNKNI